MTAASIAAPIPAGTTWTLDGAHSSVGFAVRHMVVSTFRGSFEDYDASLTVAEDGSLRLDGRVRADSIPVKDPTLAAHLRSPDFFDTDRHPEITFSSTLVRADVDKLLVDGELTIKGRSLPIQARGTITGPVVGLGDADKLGIELEALVDRTDYGLNWNAPLPKGGFALGNEVRLTATLELARA